MVAERVSGRGLFITVEGGEGAGKSTQVSRLVAALSQVGIVARATREPGGSPGAEQIRSLLVQGGTDRWDKKVEALLHFAARLDHLQRTVWPAIERGEWVVCDRFADSTLAYQGYGHGVDLEDLSQLYRIIIGPFIPDLTIILDIPADVGLARARERNSRLLATADDRYERLGIEFHQRVTAGFQVIAAGAPERCIIVDATMDETSVTARLLDDLRSRLGIMTKL